MCSLSPCETAQVLGFCGDPVIKDKEHGKKLPACLRGIEWEK